MPPTRVRPPGDGITAGLPTSLFYVTAPRRRPWRPARDAVLTPEGEIDLRDGPPDEIDLA